MLDLSPIARRYLPISFDLAGKRVAVIGNGTAAIAKLDLLRRTQAHSVEQIAASPTAVDLSGIALLFLATEDEAEDRRIAGLARSLGILVNVVDRPHLSTFAMPAIVERGPVTVAIASDGASPVLAQRVRGLIEALLPATLASLGELAQAIRATVLARLPTNAARRRFWWRLFDGAAGAAALAGKLDTARTLALADLDAVATERANGGVAFISPPDTPDLMTLRAQRLLLCADVVVHYVDASDDLLAMARRDALRIPSPTSVQALLFRLAKEGKHVVYLGHSMGEDEALRRVGIDCEIVPRVVTRPPLSVSSIAA